VDDLLKALRRWEQAVKREGACAMLVHLHRLDSADEDGLQLERLFDELDLAEGKFEEAARDARSALHEVWARLGLDVPEEEIAES
jgi:hypothetical protein